MPTFRNIRDSRSIRWISPAWSSRAGTTREIAEGSTFPLIWPQDDIIGVYQDAVDIFTPEFYFFTSVDDSPDPISPGGYDPTAFISPVIGEEREQMLQLTHGNIFPFRVTLFQRSDGSEINLTDSIVIFTMKKSYNDADVDALAQYKSTDVPSNIEIISVADGIIRVTIQPEATESLPNKREVLCPFSIKVIQSGAPFTPVRGFIKVLPETTLSNS